MGDPSKVILLEEMLRVIRDDELLDNVSRVGKKLVQGMTELQVLLLLLRTRRGQRPEFLISRMFCPGDPLG